MKRKKDRMENWK